MIDEFSEFEKIVREIYRKAEEENRLIQNPPDSVVREMALREQEVRKTKYGSLMAESEPTSRAAMFTKNSVDSKFGEKERELLEKMERKLSREKLISRDVIVGDGRENITARLIVPEKWAHVVYGGTRLFSESTRIVRNPTHTVVMFYDENYDRNKGKPLPEKDIEIRIAFSKNGRSIKIVRNSNYLGEWKKGVFTGEDWRAKQKRDAIFLHAGCRQDELEVAHGGYEIQNSLFVALSANGKTSLTCKPLARKAGEKSWLIQDDGGTLTRNGQFRGFEAGGLFVKTDGLNPSEQGEIYYACLRPESFLENVYVDSNGEIDFYKIERTSNGRAVVRRGDLMHTSQNINVDRVHNLFIITRGELIPAISKLTPEQATAFMVLGQSEESSAGDPTQEGRIRNVFFYDPFVAGDRAKHANLFYDILKSNDIKCYLLNTGGLGIGSTYRDIRL